MSDAVLPMPDATSTLPRLPLRTPLRGPTWGHALALIAAVFVARLIYLIWLSPYELAGDEAYYWEWSRHLDWCYDEKGPALGWFIAGITRIFGSHEWSVRLPVAISAAVAAWIVGRVAISIAQGDQRAGFFAVLCFCLLPGFHANAQICTQDGPIIAIWIALTAVGIRIVRNWTSGKTRLRDWLAFGALMGLGFLFKQSILLLPASFGIFVLLARKQLPWRRSILLHAFVAFVIFALCVSPMVIWNARHGWPTLHHTVGHLWGGGDQSDLAKPNWTPAWMLSLIGAQLGIFGPAFILIAILAVGSAIRSRDSDPNWLVKLWLICAAVPSLGLFVALSLTKPVIASWPIPSFVPLLPLIGVLAAKELPERSRQIELWRAQKKTRPARKPGTLFTVGWDIMVIYGISGCLLFSFPTVLLHVPLLGKKMQRPLARISGHVAHARELEMLLARERDAQNRPPVLVARYYMTAALDAFYMKSHPAVYCAGTFVGKRPTAYDFWADTNLKSPALIGRTLVLDGSGTTPWNESLKINDVQQTQVPDVFLAHNYRGIIESNR